MEIGSLSELLAAGAGLAALLTAVSANKISRQVQTEARQDRMKADELRQREADESAKRREEDLEYVRLQSATSAELRNLQAKMVDATNERYEREVAGALQAWWVVRTDRNGNDQWGIRLSNNSNMVFSSITIEQTGGFAGDIHMRCCPPGQYFIHSDSEQRNETGAWKTQAVWREPVPVTAGETYKPLFNAAKKKVDKVTFKDAVGQDWCWSADSGLEKIVGEA